MLRQVLICCALLLLPAGCGNSNDPFRTYSVTGTVTLDGKPIPTAEILLKDPSGKLRSCVASVVNGVISGESTAGEKTVEITAFRIAEGKTVPGADGTGREQATEQYLPSRYNTESELATVISKDSTELKFELESK